MMDIKALLPDTQGKCTKQCHPSSTEYREGHIESHQYPHKCSSVPSTEARTMGSHKNPSSVSWASTGRAGQKDCVWGRLIRAAPGKRSLKEPGLAGEEGVASGQIA